ncbi:Holo-[acyl-carrier-protein] synthase [Novipirellula galeiformis]|uniref:Holo-[acyl-carrier-protein] synthase n=1 Tax=Novipirellula galeiformis TaxID=2528004 RepID=A0A5C6CJI5_9BACT|nr:holo-ACP synthase [Novipirellula galeiformis]TWU25013.1 Holo-[acyl-carrier-protein] synthase [Novipirellula galeiformis]
MAILGIGTEIVECVRIAKMIEAHGEQFLERVYSANEIEYCIQNANTSQLFATRWAAKEAAMKAMRCRYQGVRWTDIEIVLHIGEGPTILLTGAASHWAAQRGIEKLHVSLGACRTHATAYIIATDELD